MVVDMKYTRTMIERISMGNTAYYNKDLKGKYICQVFDEDRHITLLVTDNLDEMYEKLKEYNL